MVKITHRKCRWAFKQQWIYLFSLKLVDKGLMKESRIQSGEKRDGCSRQSSQQHPPRDVGTRPGSGRCCRASPFQTLLKVNSSQSFGASLSNFFLVSFWYPTALWTSLEHFAAFTTHCQNELGMFIKISSHNIGKALTCLHSKCAVLFLRGIGDLYLVEYLDCRHFVWCIML